ncbi:MAG: M48 family metallopeptidase, partial [Candidatus Accumulibacter sp.]|nr:M48 family metallopeptidase [Accumulibacter sp.]
MPVLGSPLKISLALSSNRCAGEVQETGRALAPGLRTPTDATRVLEKPLSEMNHSARFPEIVARVHPDSRAAPEHLRQVNRNRAFWCIVTRTFARPHHATRCAQVCARKDEYSGCRPHPEPARRDHEDPAYD